MSSEVELTETQKKQKYLREEILEKGFDIDNFISYISNIKYKGEDINSWEQKELVGVVEKFKALTDSGEISEFIGEDSQHTLGFKKIGDLENENSIQEGRSEAGSGRVKSGTQKIERYSLAVSLADTKDNEKPEKTFENNHEKLMSIIKSNRIRCKDCEWTQAAALNKVTPRVLFAESQQSKSFGIFNSEQVVYTIQVEEIGTIVKRSTKAFAWLHQSLLAMFPANYVPALPFETDSSLLFKTDSPSSLVKRETVEQYLDHICQSKILRFSPELEAFLELKEPAFSKKMAQESRKPVIPAAEAFPYLETGFNISSVGYPGGKVPLLLDPELAGLASKIPDTLESLRPFFKQLADKLGSIQESMGQLGRDLDDVAKTLLTAQEKIKLVHHSLDIVPPDGGLSSQLMEGISGWIGRKKKELAKMVGIESPKRTTRESSTEDSLKGDGCLNIRKLKHLFEFSLNEISGMASLANNRNKLSSTYEREKKDIGKSRDRGKTFSTPIWEMKKQKTSLALQRENENLQQLRTTLAFYNANTLHQYAYFWSCFQRRLWGAVGKLINASPPSPFPDSLSSLTEPTNTLLSRPKQADPRRETFFGFLPVGKLRR